jgi:uncharacterized membrane protein (UPF0136 family)
MHQIVLWTYIAFLLAGGLIGFFKANSKVSLLTSSIAAALLIVISIPGLLHHRTAMAFTDVVLAVLLVVFAIRLGKTKKFMPGGMLIIATGAALVLLHISS